MVPMVPIWKLYLGLLGTLTLLRGDGLDGALDAGRDGGVLIGDDPETVFDAARTVDRELDWAAGSVFLGGCVCLDDPLTVCLEYEHRNDGLRRVAAFTPWHTNGWRLREMGEEEEGCSKKTGAVL